MPPPSPLALAVSSGIRQTREKTMKFPAITTTQPIQPTTSLLSSGWEYSTNK